MEEEDFYLRQSSDVSAPSTHSLSAAEEEKDLYPLQSTVPQPCSFVECDNTSRRLVKSIFECVDTPKVANMLLEHRKEGENASHGPLINLQ